MSKPHTHSLYDVDLILKALAAIRSECTQEERVRATELIEIISDGFETITYPQGD